MKVCSWVSKIAWVSAWLDKNCGFFTNGKILIKIIFFASVSSSGFTSKLLLYPNPRWLNSNKCLPVSTWERLILNLGSERILSFESDCKIKIIWQFYPWGREIKNLRYSLWAQKFFWLWRLNFFWNVEFTLKSFFSGGRSFKGPQTTFLSLKDFRYAIPKPSKL